jgi:protein MYSM1
MNQTDSDHALAMLLSQQYDDADYYSRYDHQQDEIDSKPKRKKQKSEKQEGLNTGKFSDEEVVKFKQGLDLYGRDWQRLGEYMGTRDSNAIRSHAQKYFIKLFREEVALPAKVIESGAGYTLSGKPLDPESAAAKPYLKGWVPKTALDQGKAEVAVTDKVLEKHTAKKKKKEGDFKPSVAVPKEKTEYANARPLRQRKTAFDPIAVAMQGQEHVMIPCERYQGKPGSGLPGSQPFKIKVCQNALLVVDLHSHLMATEVIGFLAGSWNSKENMLEITQALPCRSVEQDTVHHDRHINVELDPASEVQTRELVEQKGLKIVGWYI